MSLDRTLAARFLCLPACLRVAAKQLGVGIDIAALANRVGVVVPTGYDTSELTLAGIENIHYSDDPSNWGIDPHTGELSAVLNERGSIELAYEPISKFQDWEFEDRLVALTQAGLLPIVCFDYEALFGLGVSEGLGHCVVVRRVRRLNGHSHVEIEDPGPDRAGIQNIDSEALYLASRKRRGGILLITCRDSIT